MKRKKVKLNLLQSRNSEEREKKIINEYFSFSRKKMKVQLESYRVSNLEKENIRKVVSPFRNINWVTSC